jgi:hypothetical protein
MNQIYVDKKDFSSFVKSLIKINDSAIFAVKHNQITCLIGSSDNVTIAHGTLICDTSYEGCINVSSLMKLGKAIDQISEPTIQLTVNANNLEYKSPSLRFKYHLLDHGIINQPAINVKKINEFTFDIEFKLASNKLIDLSKFSAFSTDSNKVYLSCDGETVFANLTDRARSNVDNIEFEFAKCSTPFDGVPFNLDFFRSINSAGESNINVSINSTKLVIAIEIENERYKLKYITSAFTS